VKYESGVGAHVAHRNKENLEESTMKTRESKTINGLDEKQMLGTIKAIQENPSLGRFEFRARNQWITGSL
jgi:hypothetical protein